MLKFSRNATNASVWWGSQNGRYPLIHRGTRSAMTAKFLALLCVLAAMGLSAAPAHAAKSFDHCQYFVDSVPTTISTPGVWCLRQDLKVLSPTNSAINIQASNTTLDCKDFMLDGTALSSDVAQWGIVSDQQHGVTIRNCNVKGFLYGIAIYNTTSFGNSIVNNRISQNYSGGIDVVGDGSVVRGNTILNTVSQADGVGACGISAAGSIDIIDNLIAGVRATNSNTCGIVASDGSGVGFKGHIISNRVRGLTAGITSNPSVAIYIVGADHTVVRDNDITGDALPLTYGLWCRGATGVVTGNVIKGMATSLAECNLAGLNDTTN
jgi:hypothetical protein